MTNFLRTLKLLTLLILVFIVTVIEFTFIFYAFWDKGSSFLSGLTFLFQRNISIVAIGILTLASLTAFFTFIKKVNNSKELTFLSFYLLPFLLVIAHYIYLIIDNFSLERKLLDSSIIAIPFLFNLTLAYLFYIRTLKKETNT
jgi:hypothetical protein